MASAHARSAAVTPCSVLLPAGLKFSQAATDLASAPVNYLIASQVKPNIYFILDDSGSMQWSFLGDEVIDGTVASRMEQARRALLG